jgi:hypothetical protein
VEVGDGGSLPRHHGEPLVHFVPHVVLQGEGECGTKLQISLHYLAQGEGVAFPTLAPTYQAMMLEWKLVMVAACLATTGNHWSPLSPTSPSRVRESAALSSPYHYTNLAPTYHLPGYDAGVEVGDGGGLPHQHGEPLVHLVPHVPLQGEGECGTKLPIYHYTTWLRERGLRSLPLLPPTRL